MQAQQALSQHQKMTEKSIPSLMFHLGLPSAVAMIVTALYSLADALYVSALGTESGAAVGISFAIQATIQAISYTLGVGGGSLLSRKLGEKDRDSASRVAQLSFILSIFAGIAIMCIGLAWGDGLILALGATETILKPALVYSRYLLLSAPFMCGSFVCSQLLRAEGKAVYSMIGLLCGSLLNIVLDPILIYRFNYGIAGASLSTLISQVVCFATLLSAYVFKKSQIQLFSGFSFAEFRKAGKILVAGLPSAGRQGLSALATILLNHATASWGDAAIAAMSAVNRLFLLAFAFCLGIGQGMMPITGYNFGFGRYERVKKTFLIAWLFSSLLMLLLSIPFLAFPAFFIKLFRDDPAVIAIGTPALRAVGTVLTLHGTITCTNMLLQSIGKQFGATVLACARQGFFFLPLLFLLTNQFGIQSLIYVQPISDALTFLFSLPFIYHILRFLKEKTPDYAVSHKDINCV